MLPPIRPALPPGVDAASAARNRSARGEEQ
jgi:hypothetical protein